MLSEVNLWVVVLVAVFLIFICCVFSAKKDSAVRAITYTLILGVLFIYILFEHLLPEIRCVAVEHHRQWLRMALLAMLLKDCCIKQLHVFSHTPECVFISHLSMQALSFPGTSRLCHHGATQGRGISLRKWA
jgi:hypothetical protein